MGIDPRASARQPNRDHEMAERAASALKTVGSPYRITAEIGRGPFGVVFRADHERTGRPVVVKSLWRTFSDDAVGERLEQALPLLADIDHPHAVPVLDGTATRSAVLLIAGWATGPVTEGTGNPASLEDMVLAGVAVSSALSDLHSRGLFHHDVKPANLVMLPDRVPALCDVGLAHIVGHDRASRVIAQDPAMIRFRSADGMGTDPSSDVYGLAAVLFSAMAGRSPRSGRADSQRRIDLTADALPPEVPAQVARAVSRGLLSGREVGYSSADELRAALLGAAIEAYGNDWSERSSFQLFAGDAPVAEVAPSGPERLGEGLGARLEAAPAPASVMRLEMAPETEPEMEPEPLVVERAETALTRAAFEVHQPGHASSVLEVWKAATIGRGLSNGVELVDMDMSRRHFEIKIDPSGALVRDLSSKNRTKLNGTPVGSSFQRVSIGDEIRAGATRFWLRQVL